MSSQQFSHNPQKRMFEDIIVKKKAPSASVRQPPKENVREFMREEETDIPIKTSGTHPHVSTESFFKRKAGGERHISLPRAPHASFESSENPFSGFIRRRWYTKRPFLILYGVIAFTLFFVVVDAVSDVTIAITPHQEFFNIDTLLKLSASDAGENSIETIHIEESVQGDGPVTGEKNVEEKASGTVTLYNEFSSEPQILVRRTRFETPDGKIFRVNEQVTVPGALVQDGKIEPSSIEVTLAADEPGEEYNIGPTQFTIPGFKGSPRFAKFYARSLGPMAGGFKGVARVVTENDVSILASSLESRLTEELRRRASSELPEDLFIPNGASRIGVIQKSFSADVGKPADSVSLDLSLQFDGLAVPFRAIEKEVVSRYLAKDGNNADTFEIVNVRDLSYSAEAIDFEKEIMTLRVEGLAHVAWRVDYGSLASALASAGYRKQLDIFLQYPSIEEAAMIFSPSWWRVFPTNSNKIKIDRKLFESP